MQRSRASRPGDLAGRIGFVLYPHQTAFNLPADAVTLLPADVPASRGVLGANMETALNAVWDAAPGPADRIAVVGGGVVGALCAWLCAKLPNAEVTLVDIEPKRAEIATELGVAFSLPFDAPTDCDVVFHASATAAGLATALRLAGDEASVIELCWYGATEVTAPLGQAFHSRRLRLDLEPGRPGRAVAPSALVVSAPARRCARPVARRCARGAGCAADRFLRAARRCCRKSSRRPAMCYVRSSAIPPSSLREQSQSRGHQVYAVEVSDHIMIAHSFRGEVFGPAQRLHGATFAVSVAFMARTLDANGIVVDIGRAFDVLKEVLAPLNYRNLDDIVEFRGVNTTTEFLTRHVFDALAAAVKAGKLGRDGREIDAIRVTVGESPTARAWYEGALW